MLAAEVLAYHSQYWFHWQVVKLFVAVVASLIHEWYCGWRWWRDTEGE